MTQPPQSSGADDGHPEVEELADLAEGLASPARTQQLHRHLDECATCREIQEALDGVRGLLGSLPEPAPMPADIAGRIDAALAAEARYDADVSAVDVSRETAPSATQVPAPREAVSRETRPSRSHRRPSGHRTDATGPGRRARRWPRALLGAAGAAALVALTVVLIQLPETGDGDDSAADMTASQEQSQGNAPKVAPSDAGQGPLSADSLESRVLGMLQPERREGGGAGQGTPESGDDPFVAEGDAAQMPDCVRAAVNRTEAPLAAETDTYEGTPVYVVVLPHPGDAQRVDAYVVDSSCAASPDRSGEILHRDTFRRP
ncbi:anti-sigma factor family protein [Streptomyces sp. NPDC004134]|uniref:anti-sigma factor family protein n=1 Tax=Streptomyces sp. NPDC004134 TaxID=3364691 RepID=UPI003686C201